MHATLAAAFLALGLLHLPSQLFANAFKGPRPFLRKPKVRNRVTREQRKQRSEFGKQLHKELKLKYWRRHSTLVNTPIAPQEAGPDVDPRRAFVVQEVIPEMVKISQNSTPVDPKMLRQTFNIRDAIHFLTDVKTLVDFTTEVIKEHDKLSYMAPMGSFDQQGKLAADLERLVNVGKESGACTLDHEQLEPSQPMALHCQKLADLAQSHTPAFLAHAYSFFTEWHLGRHRMLYSMQRHLRLVNKFKSASHDADSKNIQRIIDLAAYNWSRPSRDEFLNELSPALVDLGRVLGGHFL